MKLFFNFSALLFLFFIGVSCSNDDDDPAPTPAPVIMTFDAVLTPVVGTGSTASGNATLKFNQTAKTIDIMVTHSGILPIHGHIRRVDGVIAFPFPETNTSSIPIILHFTITDDQIAELMANHFHIDLQTEAYPNGEISGTFIKSSNG
ncbi:CHRD domain-containing protein [Flavobacterium granuli]|uniref:Polyisoprenoid-binding protein YceI n=1 Tax=Flavobacterium granuli TaxID=280093 RepID=A0ABU1RZR4_9FLAO|nr:CHRD domain-containing protein [Flavobacterium granuli]MDR6843409.1 polyisoprenoid-binding protein YceI [Flavobacterium granuli]